MEPDFSLFSGITIETLMSLTRPSARLAAAFALTCILLAGVWLLPSAGSTPALAAQPTPGPLRLLIHRVEGPQEVTTEIVPGLRLRVRFSVFDELREGTRRDQTGRRQRGPAGAACGR